MTSRPTKQPTRGSPAVVRTRSNVSDAKHSRPTSYGISSPEQHKKEPLEFLSRMMHGKKAQSTQALDEEEETVTDGASLAIASEGVGKTSLKVPDLEVKMKSQSISKTIELPAGKFQGKNFDSDESDDDDDVEVGNEIRNWMSYFNEPAKVAQSAALSGILLRYLAVERRDMAPSLLYLVIQHYRQMLNSSKDLLREARRVAYEIYSTFIHEKSPLLVKLSDQVQRDIQKEFNTVGGDQSTQLKSLFDAAAQEALEFMREATNKLAQSINHGIDVWKPEKCKLTRNLPRERELEIFDECMVELVADLHQRIAANPESRETALLSAIATCYRYFVAVMSNGDQSGSVLGGDPDTFSLSSLSVGHSKKGIMARSIENLTSTTPSLPNSASLSKVPAFCSKQAKKSSTSLFTWKKHSVKGHSLQERLFESVAFCAVCNELLWGVAPQGLQCTVCEKSVHLKCKLNIKDACVKDKHQRSISFRNTGKGSISEPNASAARDTGHPPDRLPHTLHPPDPVSPVARVVISAGSPTSADVTEALRNHSTPSVGSDSRMDLSNSMGSDNQSAGGDASFPGGDPDLWYVNSVKQKFERSNTGVESRDGGVPAGTGSGLGSDTSSTPPSLHSHLQQAGSNPDRLSLNSLNNGSGEPIPNSGQPLARDPSVSSSDMVHELINWTGDSDMAVRETFEADQEMAELFPKYVVPVKKDETYIRLLVLLEFHHKTRYMIRHLKLFDYLLLKQWPPEFAAFSQFIALDRIPDLIELLRGLVSVIDATVGEKMYMGMADGVLQWLTESNGQNMQKWTQICQKLCCTNVLESTKAAIRENRRIPELQQLFECRFNKFVMIDALSQLRVLLFNLPLIVNNIIKDLEKKTKTYRGEADTWRKIHAKLSDLPKFIDSICMPLVHKINQGQIINGIERKEWASKLLSQDQQLEELLQNFPRTLFHHSILMHEEVVVTKVTLTMQNKVTDYIKERTDMLAIVFEEALLLLHKENDKFIFKALKSGKEGEGARTLPVFLTNQPIKPTTVGTSLNLIFIVQAGLVQMHFPKKEDMRRWCEWFTTRRTPTVPSHPLVRSDSQKAPTLSADENEPVPPSPGLETVDSVSEVETRNQFAEASDDMKRAQQTWKTAAIDALHWDAGHYDDIVESTVSCPIGRSGSELLLAGVQLSWQCVEAAYHITIDNLTVSKVGGAACLDQWQRTVDALQEVMRQYRTEVASSKPMEDTVPEQNDVFSPLVNYGSESATLETCPEKEEDEEEKEDPFTVLAQQLVNEVISKAQGMLLEQLLLPAGDALAAEDPASEDVLPVKIAVVQFTEDDSTAPAAESEAQETAPLQAALEETVTAVDSTAPAAESEAQETAPLQAALEETVTAVDSTAPAAESEAQETASLQVALDETEATERSTHQESTPERDITADDASPPDILMKASDEEQFPSDDIPATPLDTSPDSTAAPQVGSQDTPDAVPLVTSSADPASADTDGLSEVSVERGDSCRSTVSTSSGYLSSNATEANSNSMT